MKHQYYGFARLTAAFKNSLSGFKKAFSSEEVFRIEIFLSSLFLPIIAFLPITISQKAILIMSLFIVLITELLNTAIEFTVDRISKDYHEFSKYAKDIASTAVFFALLQFVIISLIILFL